MEDAAHLPRRRTALAALAALCALALLAVACGEQDGPDDGSSAPASPDTPTTSPPFDPPPASTIPDLPDNDDPAAVTCTGPPQGVFDATAIVGKSVADASAAAEAEGCSVRVVERNGRGLAVTEDFRPDRVNVAVSDGIVERIVGLG